MRALFTPTHRALHQFGGFHDLRPINRDAWLDGLAERYAADERTVQPSTPRARGTTRRRHHRKPRPRRLALHQPAAAALPRRAWALRVDAPKLAHGAPYLAHTAKPFSAEPGERVAHADSLEPAKIAVVGDDRASSSGAYPPCTVKDRRPARPRGRPRTRHPQPELRSILRPPGR